MKNFKRIFFMLLAMVLILAGCVFAWKVIGNQGQVSENGYYVVWDDFTMVSANDYSEQGYSSWDVSPESMPKSSGGGACYTDDSEDTDIYMQRQFNEISEEFVWEFTLKADSELNGTTVDMRKEATTAIRFLVNGSTLEAVTPDGNIAIGEISEDRYTLLKVKVSPAKGTYSVMTDGIMVAENLKFLADCRMLDNMYIQTTKEATGSIYLSTVRIYVGYYINEKFLNADNGLVPQDWTVAGNAETVYKTGTQGPDRYSVCMEDGAALSKEVSYTQDGAWVEYQLLIPESMDRFSMILEDAKGNSFEIATVGNEFGYYREDGSFHSLYTCQTNLWYHIMFKQTDQGGMLYLNHKLKAENIELPFKKFTKMTFVAGDGQAYLDDIVLKDWIPYPDDYVPEPTVVQKEEGDILVGLQSCNLWVEGHHFGYDWLTQYEDRVPVLGFYDETSAETADWELLYKVEHGIDFELYCWYRPQGGMDEPIKYNRNSEALHEGYFNARYSDKMKFAITWECNGGPVSGSEDFRENVVPYWIEQYFKDERYLVIDNKPVVGMYAINKLISYFGSSAAEVKEELDYLRQACIEVGFDGCYIIMANSSTDNISLVGNAGFDGQYAYNWGSGCRNYGAQKYYMTEFEKYVGIANLLSEEPISGIIPVASMGWDALAWERTGGGYCPPEDFEELLRWIKDEFIPTLDQDSLGAKMILLDNWNEYGEGHFIMPSSLYGFGCVDAVRKVFGDGLEHTDVVPDEIQKKRINHMYVQDRVVYKTKQ